MKLIKIPGLAQAWIDKGHLEDLAAGQGGVWWIFSKDRLYWLKAFARQDGDLIEVKPYELREFNKENKCPYSLVIKSWWVNDEPWLPVEILELTDVENPDTL